jgi:hypothetical protein
MNSETNTLMSLLAWSIEQSQIEYEKQLLRRKAIIKGLAELDYKVKLTFFKLLQKEKAP